MGQAGQEIRDEMRRLSVFIADARGASLPAAVVEAAEHHILDTLAAIVSGTRLHPGGLGIGYARELGGKPEALILGTSVVTGAATAALANGISAHSDETDDSHFTSRTHPGAAILPAALAVAEQRHMSGGDFLRAVVAGYDVGCRLVHALDMRGFAALHRSCHGFGGTFGAGTAAGVLHGFDAARIRHVLSYCAQSASGCGAYMHDRGHIEKAFVYAGKPAQSGVMAADMVAAGFTGADDVFSGDRNFLDAYAARPDRTALIDGLGERYEIVRTNIKKWCVGSPIQGALDGIAAIREGRVFDVAEVDEVRVHLAPANLKTVDNRPIPNVNIQHLVALMMISGTVGFAESHDPALMEDPALGAFRKRVCLVPSEELDRAKPPRQTIVEIALKNGDLLSQRVVAVRGTADNPMTRDEVAGKARDLLAPILGEDRCARLIDQVFALHRVADMASLRPLLISEMP
jgi:2-methylcitrate dehydratase PrpD